MSPELQDGEPDAFCRTCGYLLRGLPECGDCPECGRSVRSSLRAPPDLTHLPVRWLRRVRLGLCIAASGWLGLLVPFLIEVVRRSFGWGAVAAFGVPGWVFVYPSLILALIGYSIATPAHPVLQSFKLMEEFRGSARFFLIVAGTLLLGGVAAQEPLFFVGAALAFLIGLSLATKWCCDLAGRAPIERPAPGPAIPWMPIVAVSLNLITAFSGNAAMRLLGQFALGTAWLTTAYALFPALGAVNQSLRLLRDRPV